MRNVVKTETFNVGEHVVVVDDLPKEIRDSIAFWDEMNADLNEATYNKNVLSVAVTAWRSKIFSDVVDHLGMEKTEEPDGEELDDGSE